MNFLLHFLYPQGRSVNSRVRPLQLKVSLTRTGIKWKGVWPEEAINVKNFASIMRVKLATGSCPSKLITCGTLKKSQFDLPSPQAWGVLCSRIMLMWEASLSVTFDLNHAPPLAWQRPSSRSTHVEWQALVSVCERLLIV